VITLKYLVRVDTKPGVRPSEAANIEVNAMSEMSAMNEAKQLLAKMANVQVSKVRVRKIELVREAG
jgi:hypothetical protein